MHSVHGTFLVKGLQRRGAVIGSKFFERGHKLVWLVALTVCNLEWVPQTGKETPPSRMVKTFSAILLLPLSVLSSAAAKIAKPERILPLFFLQHTTTYRKGIVSFSRLPIPLSPPFSIILPAPAPASEEEEEGGCHQNQEKEEEEEERRKRNFQFPTFFFLSLPPFFPLPTTTTTQQPLQSLFFPSPSLEGRGKKF